MDSVLAELPDATDLDGTRPLGVPTTDTPSPLPPRDVWAAERNAALAHGARPSAVAATALTDEGTLDRGDEPDPGLQKRPRDLDLPPWLKGRYGTTIGRAVHGVLQGIDLATGTGLDAAVAAQCEAEAVPDRSEDVRRLVEYALESPSVRDAARSQHWREVYACTPIDDGRLLEGYIDLLYRGPEGLTVIDYKTAATTDPEVLDHRMDLYRLQGASYALAVGATTAETVARVIFLFLTRHGAVERNLERLEPAIAEVRGLVAAGHQVVLQ
jgi:ATP-dependent helicase/nuclease subunit A